MPETNNKKKIAIIAVAVVLILALVAAAVALVLRNAGDNGPEDANGNPLYPKASDIASVEYLHRDGIDGQSGIAIEEKELTDPAAIESFLAQLKALALRDPTEKERASIDYTADVEMFTLKQKKGNDIVLLIMGDSIGINNEYGNYFYMTDGLDLKALTKDFGAMDLSDKLVSSDTEATTSN